MLRKLLIRLLIRYFERDIHEFPEPKLSKEEWDTMMSGLWQSPAFRKYLQDRDSKLIFTMAGSEGMAPEPRDAGEGRIQERLARSRSAVDHRCLEQRFVELLVE